MAEILGKIPPQNLEAEQAVLGAILTNKEAMDKVVDILQHDDFYLTSNQTIFRAILRLFDKRSPIDLVTLTNELESSKQLDDVGGAAYLAELVNAVPSAIHVAHYAEIVRNKSVLRRILSAGQKIADLGYEEEREVAEIMDEAERALFEVGNRQTKNNFMPISDILATSFDRIDRLHREKGVIRGVTSGYRSLDNKLSGFQQSDLIILAARPSMGKCVSGDTKIIDPETGDYKTAREIVQGRSASVVALSKDWRFIKTKPNKYYKDGYKPTYRIKTALGYELIATLAHPLLTINGWRHMIEINIGDRIATSKKLPFFGSDEMRTEEVKLLAYYIADGSVTDTQSSPGFTNDNAVIVNEYRECVTAFDGHKVVMRDSDGSRTPTYFAVKDKAKTSESKALSAAETRNFLESNSSVRKQLVRAGLSNSSVSNWLTGSTRPSRASIELMEQSGINFPQPSYTENEIKKLLVCEGVWGKRANNKTIPRSIFRLPKNQLAIFINRLFSCDGSAYVCKTARSNYEVISYSTTSGEMASQLQHLLLRFGILSKIRTRSIKYKGTRRAAFELEIRSREMILLFAQEIGIFGKEKALETVASCASSRRNGFTKDTLPLEIWELINKVKGNRSWASIARDLGLSEGANLHQFKRRPRRDTVYKIATVLDDEQLKEIATSDIFWDRVVSVEPYKVTEVFDLTVEGEHNFVANNFVVHNTSFSLNIALNAAVKSKTPVGFFSLEQSKEQIVDRLICAQAMVDGWKLRTGNLSEDDFPAIGMAMGVLAEAPLFIDDTPMLTVLDIRTRARRLKAEHNLGMLIIDYLQLINSAGGSGGEANRVQQVSEISRNLKAIARELDIPVIALSQLSRAVESRDKKIPQLSDLRESGSIEQDADVVMFLYREDYYDRESERKGITDVLIRKHRNGPIGEVELHFRDDQGRFFDIERKKKKE